MTTTVETVLHEHSDNIGYNPRDHSRTGKAWANAYEPIKNLFVHEPAIVVGPPSGTPRDHNRVPTIRSNDNDPFDDHFFPMRGDDAVRFRNDCNRPNKGKDHSLGTEADARAWFNTEIADPTLAAFTSLPALRQENEFATGNDTTVDVRYSFAWGDYRIPVAVGEFKRNIINNEWREGKLKSSQQMTLSRELRGYAIRTGCTECFCFDIDKLLILRFRAIKESNMKDADTPVDCWVLDREDNLPGQTTLRYAFYRLLVQGIRRQIGLLSSPSITIGSHISTDFRQWYSGKSMWRHASAPTSSKHPDDLERMWDGQRGGFYWKDPDAGAMPPSSDATNWDTMCFYERLDLF